MKELIIKEVNYFKEEVKIKYEEGGDSANGNNYVDNLTTTNMWTVCDGGGGYWIAIGY